MGNTSGAARDNQTGLLGFISGLFSNLLGEGTGDREKRRRLKEIRKELKKRSRFFKLKGDMALPGMAKWFHDLYKIVGPVDILLEKYGDSELLKTVLIESFLPEDVRTLADTLQPEAMKDRLKEAQDPRVVAEQAKEELIQLYSALDAPTAKRINKLYGDLAALRAFSSFSYYFLLKKFDSMLPERDFIYNPRFEAINAQYIKDDLMDFLDVYYSLDPAGEWDVLFDILKTYREMDVVSRTAWKKVLQARREMMKYRTFDLVIRHLEEDPDWAALPEMKNVEIVESYFNRVKSGVELAVRETLRERKKSQQEALLTKLFGTTAVSRTQYYTERENLTFHKKMLSGFTYVEPINYLKAFYLDYFKSKVRILVDLMLIQGKWATKISSQQFSEAYHQLLSLSENLIAFDAQLADDAPQGSKIKRLLRQSARDRSALINMKAILQDLNNEAKSIINSSAQNMIILGKNIKQLINEYRAGSSEIIINWKEVESWADPPVDAQLVEAYTRIYHMVQLLQLCLKD
ncbi:MAG: DUF5312 domain-containing protein [Spirochaetales bacterium]|nr:DUF5312 domain-containing protein [Spirochaetales bacterium]